MRKLFVMAMVAGLVGAGGFVRDASAGVTVDLLFVGKNGGAIAATNSLSGVAPSDALTMAITFRSDVTLTGLAVSVGYDPGVSVTSATQWGGVFLNKAATVSFSGLGTPTDDPIGMVVGSFVGAVQPPGTTFQLPAGATYQIGTVVWHADGIGDQNILVGFFNTGIDGAFSGGVAIPLNELVFHPATANIVPEPGTAALLGFGLVGLVLAGRRNRA